MYYILSIKIIIVFKLEMMYINYRVYVLAQIMYINYRVCVFAERVCVFCVKNVPHVESVCFCAQGVFFA